MSDHLGIGLALELYALAFELLAQLAEIFDDAVMHNGENIGRGRSYAKVASGPNSAVSYQGILDAIDAGNSYVSDGRSHLMNFKVEGQSPSRRVGTEIKLPAPTTVSVAATVTALLPVEPETIEVLGTTYPLESQKTAYEPMPEWLTGMAVAVLEPERSTP